MILYTFLPLCNFMFLDIMPSYLEVYLYLFKVFRDH